MKEIVAYTDGSAVVSGINAGKGGFGAYILDGDKEVFLSGGRIRTKTGRMELTAFLSVLKWCNDQKEEIHLKLYSDSQYVVKAFTDSRLVKWVSADWRNSSGKVKSQDLWKQVVEILESDSIHLDIEHVKGHKIEKVPKALRKKYLEDHPHIKGNTVADILADYKRHKNFSPDLSGEQYLTGNY